MHTVTKLIGAAVLAMLAFAGQPVLAQQATPAPSAAADTSDRITITGKSIDAWKAEREQKEQMFDILDDPGICPDGFVEARRGLACAIITYDVLVDGQRVGGCNAPIFRLLRDGGPLLFGAEEPVDARTEGDYVAVAFRRLPCPPDAKAREVALVTIESLLKPEKKSKTGTELRLRMVLGYQQLLQQCNTMTGPQRDSCAAGLDLFDFTKQLDNCAFALIWGPAKPQCKLRG